MIAINILSTAHRPNLRHPLHNPHKHSQKRSSLPFHRLFCVIERVAHALRALSAVPRGPGSNPNGVFAICDLLTS